MNPILLPNAELVFEPNFLPEKEAFMLQTELVKTVSWRQDTIQIFGKQYPTPRLTAFYGDRGKTYTYSHIRLESLEWLPTLLSVKEKIEQFAQNSFNCVLLNYYRNGQDSMGWHADDEPELGQNPVIASLSLGMTRKFMLKHKQDKTLKYNMLLNHGSLLLMQGSTQHHWLHQIPKIKSFANPRLNLTFRMIR